MASKAYWNVPILSSCAALAESNLSCDGINVDRFLPLGSVTIDVDGASSAVRCTASKSVL